MHRVRSVEKADQRYAETRFHRDNAELTTRRQSRGKLFLVLGSLALLYLAVNYIFHVQQSRSVLIQQHSYAPEILDRCRTLDVKPAPPNDFYSRTQSDRFAPGTRATVIRNATIWTGFDDGKEILQGDMLLDGGIIRWIG